MKILLICFSIVYNAYQVEGDCTGSWFGPSCKFQCNCDDNRDCDKVTGDCRSCRRGFYGPSCQYVNVAFSKPSRHTTSGGAGYEAWRGNDEWTSSCSLTTRNLNQHWTVNLGSVYWLTDMEILIGILGTKNLMVYAGNASDFSEDLFLCSKTSLWVSDTHLHVTCSPSVLAQYVFVRGDIQTPAAVSICEICINGGRNIALKRDARQTSTYTERSFAYEASLAVDGNPSTFFGSRSCTHTDVPGCSSGGGGTDKPSWTVRLGREFQLSRAVVYNRQGLTYRLGKFRVLVGTTSLKSVYRETKDDPPLEIPVTFPRNLIADRLQVKLYGDCRILTLCEVQIYGDCPDFLYGLECNETCRCRDRQEVCRKLDGRCLSGCPVGRKGISCGEECSFGTFGLNCTSRCNETCAFRDCNPVSGQCSRGCEPGWTGQFCENPCPLRTFGVNCTQRCSVNCVDRFCNNVNGTCTQGCLPGWLTHNCSKACSRGSFGQDCLQPCSSTCRERDCRHTDGYCLNGCLAGWMGPRCQDLCARGMYGENCAKQCEETCVKKVCDSVIGNCTEGCVSGRLGTHCTESCPEHTYGVNCNQTCSETCFDRQCKGETGACTSGCIDGLEGEFCEKKKEDNTSIIAAIVVVVAVLLIVLAIIIFVVIRRRRPPKQKQVSEGQVYENIATATGAIKFSNLEDEIGKLDGKEGIDSDDDTDITVETIEDDLTVDTDVDNNDNIFVTRQKESGTALTNDRMNNTAASETDAIYSNMYQTDIGSTDTTIKLSDLPDLMKEWRTKEHYFLDQFKRLPRDLQAPHTVAFKEHNRRKNRYKNICAYDHSRVVLSSQSGVSHDDYINACYIDGFKKKKAFVASQGPTDVIIDDFIRMIWELDTKAVVMLTNLIEDGKRKCEAYWPDKGESVFGQITVELKRCEVFTHYTLRTLQLSKEGLTPHTVVLYHYTSWPDKSVPPSPWSLLEFREKVRKAPAGGPTVIHCSAGVGRTGTFIGLDCLLDQAASDSEVDVYACVWKMRQQRVNMVQTLDQYQFLHEAVTIALLTAAPIPVDEFDLGHLLEIDEAGVSNVCKEFQSLLLTIPPPKSTDFLSAMTDENKSKNRSSSILASDKHRPRLITPAEFQTEYINAVFLPGYFCRRAYIQTQTPLPLTELDLWRLVFDHNVTTIAMLDNCKDADQTVGEYWPHVKDCIEVGAFFLECTSAEISGDLLTRTLVLTYENESVEIKQFSSPVWSDSLSEPDSSRVLLMLIEAVQERSRNFKKSPVLVHCRNGCDRSGLFCTVATALDRLKHEQDIAIPYFVSQMKIPRNENVSTVDQYLYCYTCLNSYLERSEGIYSNMTPSHQDTQ